MDNIAALPEYNDDFFDNQISDMGRFTVIITGRTGVGKSYLINKLFNEKVAPSASGLPVTKEMKKYDSKIHPLSIYDTKGFEQCDNAETVNQITSEINMRMKKGKQRPGELIHAIWHCVHSGLERIEQSEIDFIKMLYENTGVQIYIILTQTLKKKKAEELISVIKSQFHQKINPKWNERIHLLKLLAGDDDIEGNIIKAFGLDDLIRLNFDTLPSTVRFLLATAQQHSKKIKHDEAMRIIESYVKTSGFSEFLRRFPILGAAYALCEFRDREYIMITKICELYGIDTRLIKTEMKKGRSLYGKVDKAKADNDIRLILSPILNSRP